MRTCAAPSSYGELTPQQRRGKQIYLRGQSNSGHSVYAILGDPPMKVSAGMLPCVNCHGFDGHGVPEGGLTPSNVTWSALTKHYGVTHSTGRRHRAYDETTLKRAITDGIDPSQNKLGVGMPRFSMDDGDLSALVAYLKMIETDRDPGVTEAQITVATVLPFDGRWKSSATAVRDVLNARFAEVNDGGGLYNRKIVLRVIEAADDHAASIARLRKVLESEPIFALIAPFLPGATDELASLAAEREIPIVLPLGGLAQHVDGSNRFVFYLHAGLELQARALLDDFFENGRANEASRVVIITRTGNMFETLAQAVKAQGQARGLGDMTVMTYDRPAALRKMPAGILNKADVLFFFGLDAEGGDLLKRAEDLGLAPQVYMVSALLGEKVVAAARSFRGKLLVAFPNSRSAQSPTALADFRRFLDRHRIAFKPNDVSLTTYCAATFLIEALKQAGKQLRREQLIRKLEGLYEFHTGLTHDVTYGPNRRIGTYGAYIVTFDPTSHTIARNSRWVEPKD